MILFTRNGRKGETLYSSVVAGGQGQGGTDYKEARRDLGGGGDKSILKFYCGGISVALHFSKLSKQYTLSG